MTIRTGVGVFLKRDNDAATDERIRVRVDLREQCVGERLDGRLLTLVITQAHRAMRTALALFEGDQRQRGGGLLFDLDPFLGTDADAIGRVDALDDDAFAAGLPN